MTRPARRARPDDDADWVTYKLLAWKGAYDKPTTLTYPDPVSALVSAVDYLKLGYQVRLNDACVKAYAEAAERRDNNERGER